jgi:hypothetical protein
MPLGVLVDLFIWDYAWLSLPLAGALIALLALGSTRKLAERVLLAGTAGGLLWIIICHVLDYLDRGVWLAALPVAYRYEFGSGFFWVGSLTLLIFGTSRVHRQLSRPKV